MKPFIIHGPSFPGSTKVVLLALEEKGVRYELRPFEFPGRPEGFERLNPFLKVPVIEHDNSVIYETSAIVRYIDEVCEGPRLQPVAPLMRARMNQIISIMDQVGTPTMLRTIYQQRFLERVQGQEHDEGSISEALPRAETCLLELDRFVGARRFLVGEQLSLADLFVFPTVSYFGDTVEGDTMLAHKQALKAWLGRMRERPSVQRVGLPSLPAPKAA